MITRSSLTLAAILATLGATSPTLAQPSEAQLATYRAVALEGQDAFNRGEYVEARRLWQHARSVVPNPRVYRLLGRAASALGDHVEAVRMYELALSAPPNGNALTDAHREEVANILLPEAREHVGEILLEVEPADAAVRVDGRPADVQQGSLILPVGRYTLTVRRPGFVDHEQHLEVLPRARDPLRVALSAAPIVEAEAAVERRDTPAPDATPAVVAAPSALPAREAAPAGPDLTGPTVLFVLSGVGLLTFGAGAIWAHFEQQRVDDSCTQPDRLFWDPCGEDDLAALRTITTGTDIAWISAASLGALAIVWLAVAIAEAPENEAPATSLLPWASPSAAGLVLSHSMEAF